MARPLKPVFSREEINQLLKPMTAAVTHAVTATGSTPLRTHEADYLQALYLYEPSILALAQAAEPPAYDLEPTQHARVQIHPSTALRNLGAAWNWMDTLLNDGCSTQQQPLRHLHPRLAAFYQAYAPLMHQYGSHVTGSHQALPAPRADEFAQRYSEAFTTFQQQVRSPALAAEVNRLQKRSRRHAEGQRAYIDALLEQGPLVVTYLQLGYVAVQEWQRPLQSLKQDLHRLLHTHPGRALRNEALLGFIWKLADGIERGYYSHLLLFHRADCAPDETALLGALQQCWIHDITQGAGACYRMTYSLRGRQNLLAHTRIDSRDAPDYRTLCDFIEYLNRLDQLYRLEAPKGTSIYGRSHLPGSQAGRSHRTSHDTLSHE